MEHAEAQGKLEAYFAGTLPREQVRAFHEHLKACEQCRSLIRIRGAGQRSRRTAGLESRYPADVQSQMDRNRGMLWRILLLILAAAFLAKLVRR